ncbi:TetR family transcriptional regulator [Streptomyces sp. AJS327]|uniref:TetR/AcrR family transcriptional regulator n=1 Tax=Streptomyces sp. AJS327 TaxID=2545265 RepID=UPI0015DF6D2F|nr:TetR/AcrR family transcriptional regulator [Streptomyces sp. AJS327]MBA0049363.1 TetR family transcriptional regulator [Streptomyces sp. AJS327]
MTGRREEVLDAAIEVLGTGGLRRLTYQAVDAAAGVPQGTTSNHFRNRDLLVEGVVTHIATLDARDWGTFAETPAAGDPAELAGALARVVQHVLGPARSRTAARYALALEGIARPTVREPLNRARESLIDLTSAWLRELGSPTPLEDCRTLFTYLEGLIFQHVTTPRESFDPEPGIRTVLSALLPDGADGRGGREG